MSVDTSAIRDIIQRAQAHEQATSALRKRLEPELPSLEAVLILPAEAPIESLMSFISGYVQSVPSCLQLVTAVSKQLGFFEYAAPFLHMAEDYFLQPPADIPDGGGLEALLDESFLAHRLLEEVNDHHVRHLQRPLLPLDMTEANIIVHHLLGDSFATRLEELVQFTASQLLSREHLWQEARGLATAQPGHSPASLSPDSISSDSINPEDCRIRLRLAG